MFQLIKNLLSVRPEATAAQTEKRIAGQYPKEYARNSSII